MTSMPGGAADKAGNRYEHLWTSYRVADLLEGSASRLRLEPPGIAGQGVEFEIDDGDGTWAEQVKGSLSGSSWTIRRLDSEGVLASALVQVQAGRQFRFVAALRASELETLSKRSRETSSLDEFKEALPKSLEADFDVLVDMWAVPASEAWSYLKSIHVVTVSPEALERMVVPIFKHLIAGDPSAVLDAVRGFCDVNLHKDLTGPLVWAHLEGRGFQRRLLAGSCSDEVLDELERAVLAYQPSWEREPQGRGRYALLDAIDETRLGADARRQRDELATRFASAVVPPPRPITTHVVRSPIDDSDAQAMSDDEWLEALRTYSGQTTWDGDTPVGGAAQLAQVLGTRAEHEPERFARLALGFDASVPSDAFENVIRAVATGVTPELLADLEEHSAEIHRAELGQVICSVASRITPMTDRLVALVVSYVDDPDPDREWARTNASSGQEYFGGDLDSAGLNSTRGQVANAAAIALFQSGGHLEVLRPVVERLAGDQILGVRAHAAAAVLALMNHEAERANAAAETLFDTSDEIFDSQYTMRLLMYLIIRQPERFGAQLLRALNADDDIARRAGQVWAGAAIRHGLPSAVPADLADLPQAARCGAAQVFAEYPGSSAEFLARSFSDEDREVRKAAAAAMRQLEDTTDVTAESLVESFLTSAFDESYDQLVQGLPDLSQVGPELALRVCERAVELAGAELGDIRTARSTMGQQVMRVVMAIYRQGDTAVRARCLDVIDRLSERDAYGWRELIEDER